MSCLAEGILFLKSGHTQRERERRREGEGGGGGQRLNRTYMAGVNFAFSSMPNDVHAEEKQARLQGELKCKSEEIGRVTKRTVAYRPAVSIDPLESRLGFSHMSILASPLSGPHERRPMASRKEQLSSLFFVA